MKITSSKVTTCKPGEKSRIRPTNEGNYNQPEQGGDAPTENI